MSEMCAQHPEVAAQFRCDACGKLLCGDCIRKGHALLFCSLCGERALPLAEGQPATVKQVLRHEAVTKPYSFADALGYPFRGSGLLMFIVAVVSMMLVQILLNFGMGLWRYLFAAGFWGLMIGLQFSIVRTTAEGENELPDAMGSMRSLPSDRMNNILPTTRTVGWCREVSRPRREPATLAI